MQHECVNISECNFVINLFATSNPDTHKQNTNNMQTAELFLCHASMMVSTNQPLFIQKISGMNSGSNGNDTQNNNQSIQQQWQQQQDYYCSTRNIINKINFCVIFICSSKNNCRDILLFWNIIFFVHRRTYQQRNCWTAIKNSQKWMME